MGEDQLLAGLRVAFIAGTLGQGGAERQLYYMLSALVQAGARPSVLSLTQGEFWDEPIRALGVPVTWVGHRESRLARLWDIIGELRRQAPQIVQSQHFYTNLYAAGAARILRLPEVGALRSDGISEVRAHSSVIGHMSLRAPRVVAANSLRGLENAVALGMPRPRMHFLPNVVDTRQFDRSSAALRNPVCLLAVGRLVLVKRFDRFLRTLAIVRDRARTPVRGIIVGDGPERPRLEAVARELALGPETLAFHGAAADVGPLYRGADLLMLTSDWEGPPNVVLEAMAASVPVVATRVGGVPDVVRHGETGLLVDAADEDGLAESVLALVDDPAARERFGCRARALIEEHHSLARLQTELCRLYGALLRAPGRRWAA